MFYQRPSTRNIRSLSRLTTRRSESSFNPRRLMTLGLIIILGILIWKVGFSEDPLVKTEVTSANQLPVQSPSLQQIVQTALDGAKGDYAVVIKNLNTNEQYTYNETRTFDSGSLYKLWVMATVYQQIDAGELTADQTLSQSIPDLNRQFGIDPEYAELSEGGISMPVKQALNQMITISHNYAAMLLTQKIKLSAIASWLENHGFNQSSVGTDGDAPKTTAADIAAFFEKLYYHQFATPEQSEEMLTLLKNQKLNKKLPRNLPEGTVIAHKTGEIDWFSHDAGIVYTDKGNYIIVVMSETSSPPGAEERIAALSEAVYHYFKTKNPT